MKLEIKYPNKSLYNFLLEKIDQYPDYIAINYFNKKITYDKLNENIIKIAKSLKQIGIKKGDILTICMPNTPEAIYTFYATNMIGAIANMVHPLSAEKEIEHYLKETNSKAILTIDLAFEKVKRILKNTKLKKVIVVSVKESMPSFLKLGYSVTQGRKVPRVKYNNKIINWRTFSSYNELYKKEVAEKVNKNDVAVILHSGGTTGYPKGIMLSNLNFNAVAVQSIKACGNLKPKDKSLAIMPIFHGFGLGIGIHTTLNFVGEAIILPRFDAKTFDKLILKYKPNIMSGVPALYEAMIKNKGLDNQDLSFLKCVVSGGDSLSVSLKEKIDQFLKEHHTDIQVREGYGLTESVTASCLTPANKYKPGSVGLPYPDMQYKIVEPNTTNEVPFLTDGEIAITGPSLMKGYLNDPKATKEVLRKHPDGQIWLHTGDMGNMDEEGYVFFKQRIKRLIISSGYNIYPQQIENAIDSYSDVLISVVIGKKNEIKKEIPKAFVVLKAGVEASDDLKAKILKHCEKHLAKYAMPKEIEFRTSLPKTLVGKIAYTELMEEENKKDI